MNSRKNPADGMRVYAARKPGFALSGKQTAGFKVSHPPYDVCNINFHAIIDNSYLYIFFNIKLSVIIHQPVLILLHCQLITTILQSKKYELFANTIQKMCYLNTGK